MTSFLERLAGAWVGIAVGALAWCALLVMFAVPYVVATNFIRDWPDSGRGSFAAMLLIGGIVGFAYKKGPR